MKLLTANFISCAVKACKSSSLSFPLHFKDAELASKSVPYNPLLLSNLLPRLDWPALVTSSKELGFTLPDTKPELPRLSATAAATTTSDGDMNMDSGVGEEDEKTLRMLHKVLMETEVVEGKMVCGSCGFEYGIHQTVGNFLLPSHLV
ncbi:hypothetical protein TWF225_011130 [Orbilia oligospora]|uniref:Uncharacterized protein n=1 Tax=Orbilia oligospora TaxID=2813651 RepID=A0A7C8K5R0_ORBOL|nr:hypothetical protein TWF751_001833 [Orbilia oligospora]KAF3170156.1 hypothetical protein TWF225_011130 [Orbilia oligospora]KAF3248540.1 hypothetical protein TWF217_009138 [Orbilia oligospora]KAF3251326.1 hypothetical protein TWF128_007327 [Orbilia oligospora]KAF3288095.1 hypothetical protein TWF132_008073 [Orbilia oligospora]